MGTRISYVELELGREPQYPFGERGRLYHLFLPLRPDGRVDTEALGQNHGCCRGTRLRASDGAADGKLGVGPHGRIVLEYENDRCYPSTLLLDAAPLTVGSSVPNTEYNGERHEYQVIAVRPASGSVASARAKA
jgi:hypothetical protein